MDIATPKNENREENVPAYRRCREGNGKGHEAAPLSPFPSFEEGRDDVLEELRNGDRQALRLAFDSPLQSAVSPIMPGGKCGQSQSNKPAPAGDSSKHSLALLNHRAETGDETNTEDFSSEGNSRENIDRDSADESNIDDEGETAEDRRRREEEESEALARHLMAEEAFASYNISTDFLRNNADQYSEEDLAALEAAMAEEDDVGEEIDVADQPSEELSYDALLRLSERIGDVKQERWTMQAEKHIKSLPTVQFVSAISQGKDENDSAVKCLVCQCQYEEGDILRNLPCGHCFHRECVDPWLSTKDICPYCRQSIVK